MVSYGIGDPVQIDFVDLSKFSKYNRGVKYLLTAIDIFSKYAYDIPLKRKNAANVLGDLAMLFKKLGIYNLIKAKNFGILLVKNFFPKKV